MKLEFIKNILDVDVDGMRGVNHYVVKAMYNAIDDEGFADTTFKPVADFKLTWDEIEKKGGIAAVNRVLKERYGV